ncbi:MAG: hypothetical protein H0U18_17200 [Pyrinomonadaceae bacterium]|jgi:hypothetical protein|nr:hypothetical protein [Pyrinomonadaceae bacterium]
MKTSKKLYHFLMLLALGCSGAVAAQAQDNKPGPPASPEKAEGIIKRGIEAVGGSAYLKVQSVIGRGFYTAYQDGMSQLPTRFLDYIVYPDKERTEFTTAGVRVVQTNAGSTGWVYDGATKSLNDQKPAQIEDFKRSMRTSIDNVLRGWWRSESATLSYVGRREAGLAKRNEAVRLTYPDGFWIEYEFGAKDGLPARVIYKRNRKLADSDETEEITEEDRLAKPISTNGVTAAFVVDHFINSKQTSRINYESIEFNRPLAASLFAKPENAKSVK